MQSVVETHGQVWKNFHTVGSSEPNWDFNIGKQNPNFLRKLISCSILRISAKTQQQNLDNRLIEEYLEAYDNAKMSIMLIFSIFGRCGKISTQLAIRVLKAANIFCETQIRMR